MVQIATFRAKIRKSQRTVRNALVKPSNVPWMGLTIKRKAKVIGSQAITASQWVARLRSSKLKLQLKVIGRVMGAHLAAVTILEVMSHCVSTCLSNETIS